MTKRRRILEAPMFLFGTISSAILFTLAIHRLSGSFQAALVYGVFYLVITQLGYGVYVLYLIWHESRRLSQLRGN
ncbi:hypothetical protein [Rhizobium etli]|nr:hypothetical protein [Rhizobium etli]